MTTEFISFDYTPLSLGIETSGGVMTKLIPSQSSIPCQKSVRCSTKVNGQTSVEIHILRGERFLAKDNQRLGTLHLTGIFPTFKGVPQIDVTFNVDYNGILTVTAEDLGNNHQVAIAIYQATVMEAIEIELARKDAEFYAETDDKLQKTVIAREKAENLINYWYLLE